MLCSQQTQRAYYDEAFVTDCIGKAKICYERVIFRELIRKKEDRDIKNCVYQVRSDLWDSS